MDLLKEIQRKLDTHKWGEIRYSYYSLSGKFIKKIPYRRCQECMSYNSPNSIKECRKSLQVA